MALETAVRPIREARSLPLYRRIPSLSRDLPGALAKMGEEANGEVVRLDAKLYKPYLISHPDHLQHVLRTNAQNYERDSAFFRPLFRFFPEGVLGRDEENASFSRQAMRPLFAMPNIQAMTERLIDLVNSGLDAAEGPAAAGTPLPVGKLMGSVVNKAVVGLVFGDKITQKDADALDEASHAIVGAVFARIVTPFLPERMPRFGDRRFYRAVRVFDDIMGPIVRDRETVEGRGDLMSLLLSTPQPDGGPAPESWLRDNFVAMYGAGTETTAVALTWLWPAIAAHPEVHERLKAEVDAVVGDGPVRPEHLRRLTYTRQVIDELQRWRPTGWLFSRVAAEEDVIGGVRIRKGTDVVISPWVTHQNPALWDRPEVFDPERFAPGAPSRHRYAYFPFGGGPHQCVGQHLFLAEAVIVVASLLSRFDLVKVENGGFTPKLAVTLRPKDEAMITLRPRK